MARFDIVPEWSIVTIEARSSVGPIHWEATGPRGYVDAAVNADGVLDLGTSPTAYLELEVERLKSGNALYDAELLRRIDARRFPTATVELKHTTSLPSPSRFQLSGEVTFHGVTREAEGAVTVSFPAEHKMLIDGEQVFDIRDFDVPSPTLLRLRIFPDVRVRLHVEAQPADG